MAEPLPITIKISRDIAKGLKKSISLANKLEAQFNFQALTANWFGDEDKITFITLHVETEGSLLWHTQQNHSGDVHRFADDVVGYFDNNNFCIECYIAFTSSELNLLQQQEKLLPAFLQVKLQKVLNLIAANMEFHPL